MKASLSLIFCTACVTAVQLSQLNDPAQASSNGSSKTSFKRTFPTLPVKVTITSQGSEAEANNCQWAVDELKRVSLDNERLQAKLAETSKQFAEQQNSLIERLGDLQDTYQQLYQKYKKLKSATQSSSPAELAIEDCLAKVKDNGWLCTKNPPSAVKPLSSQSDAPTIEATPAAEPIANQIIAPIATEDSCKDLTAELDATKEKLKAQADDFSTLKCEKEKLEQDNKKLNERIETLSAQSQAPETKDAGTSTADKPEANQVNQPDTKADANPLNKPVDSNVTSSQDAIQAKLAAANAELSKCLEAKSNFTAFISDISDSLSKCSKTKEDLEGQIKALKESSIKDELKGGVTVKDLINRASSIIGGRRYN